MNDPSLPENNEEWIEFEQKLRSHSLGSNLQKRDELLYQCGCAAGYAASMKQRQHSVRRWQVLSVVASLFACVTLASHYLPMDFINDAQETALHMEHSHKMNAVIDASDKSSKSWGALLTAERRPDSQRLRNLSAVGMILNDDNVRELEGVSMPVSPDGNGTLRPKDFPLFLRGDV